MMAMLINSLSINVMPPLSLNCRLRREGPRGQAKLLLGSFLVRRDGRMRLSCGFLFLLAEGGIRGT